MAEPALPHNGTGPTHDIVYSNDRPEGGDWKWFKTPDGTGAWRRVNDFKEVDLEEFCAFIASYPRKLEVDVSYICEPPLVSYNDFERSPYWPDSVVGSYLSRGGDPNDKWAKVACKFRILTDINAPVDDDGARDTDQRLYDNNGVELHEGDEVDHVWGWGPPNTTFFGREHGPDGADIRREKILIRDKGTKYERWSFESCHNHVHGSDMVKVAGPPSPAQPPPR